MKQNMVAYPNLRAEMARTGVSVVGLAQEIDMNRDTLARNLAKKTPIKLADAFKIQQRVFPQFDLRYLFAEEAE